MLSRPYAPLAPLGTAGTTAHTQGALDNMHALPAADFQGQTNPMGTQPTHGEEGDQSPSGAGKVGGQIGLFAAGLSGNCMTCAQLHPATFCSGSVPQTLGLSDC